MRFYLFVAAAALSPLMSEANDTPPARQSSIVNIDCAHCPPLKEQGKISQYQPPDIAGQVQETVVIDVDGKKQMVRSEQWLGGAPVRYVSHSKVFLPPEAALMATPGLNIDKPDDGVDDGAKTAAVGTAEPLNAEALPLRP